MVSAFQALDGVGELFDSPGVLLQEHVGAEEQPDGHEYGEAERAHQLGYQVYQGCVQGYLLSVVYYLPSRDASLWLRVRAAPPPGGSAAAVSKKKVMVWG